MKVHMEPKILDQKPGYFDCLLTSIDFISGELRQDRVSLQGCSPGKCLCWSRERGRGGKSGREGPGWIDHNSIPHSCALYGERSWESRVKWDLWKWECGGRCCFNSCLCFSPYNSIFKFLKNYINFPLVGYILLMVVTGKWSSCFIFLSWTFASFFLPVLLRRESETPFECSM